jgi:hypothetical protein
MGSHFVQWLWVSSLDTGVLKGSKRHICLFGILVIEEDYGGRFAWDGWIIDIN